jgi:chitin disaccharide deacetylase
VIVNADDFGLDEAVNRGIVLAFEQGLVSSTTLLANHSGFEHAVELAHAHGLAHHVGVHLNLTTGAPLTEPIKSSRRFCDADGAFWSWSADSHAWRVVGHEREALTWELRAQVERVRAAGLPVTHVDSHHHVHNKWGVGDCVIAVATQLGVPRIRIARNCGRGISLASRVYKKAFNRRLSRGGFAGTRWFGEVDDWIYLRERLPDRAAIDDFELMTHPTLNDRGVLVDAYSGGRELATLLEPVDGLRSAISHAGARYGA